MQEKKYLGYSDIDFLKDDDFLKWMIFREKDDNEYWKLVLEENPELNSSFEKAVSLYKTQIRFNDYSISNEIIEYHYNYFHHRVSQRNTRRKINLWLSAAAALLLLFTITQIYKDSEMQNPNLMEFVKANPYTADSTSGDIQLLVSSDQMIRIEEKEPSISYNPDSISITGKSIAGVKKTEYSQLIVPRGKRSKLFLSDGTMLHVNAGTKVVYPNQFADDIREIYVNGEVFLEVSPNSNKPFIVKTNEVEVKVLGTSFNVCTYEEDYNTQIVLASGAVMITNNQNKTKTELAPSQMYHYINGHTSVMKVDVVKYISWINGIIYVEDERFDVLMTRLSRYYGEAILYDENVVNQQCSGKVDLKSDLGDVLNGLTFSFPINVEFENGIYYVKTR